MYTPYTRACVCVGHGVCATVCVRVCVCVCHCVCVCVYMYVCMYACVVGPRQDWDRVQSKNKSSLT